MTTPDQVANIKLDAEAKLDEATTSIHYQSSPFYTNLMGLNRAVEEHLKTGARVGANRKTNAVFYYAEELFLIEQGVTEGKLDQLGYPIEDSV